MADFQRRVTELRFVEGIEKVEHVPYPSGDEFWVRVNDHFDMKKLGKISKNHAAVLVKFGGLPSKLPRPLGEVLWNGVSYVITKKINEWGKFTSSLGFEPDGIAKIASDAHGPYQIFITTQEEGVQIIYEYLGLKYTAPIPPPKLVVPPKPPAATVAKPAQQAPRPVAPTAPAIAVAAAPAQPAQAESAPTGGPAPGAGGAIPKGQYHPHAWGQIVTGTSEQQSPPPKSTEEKATQDQTS